MRHALPRPYGGPQTIPASDDKGVCAWDLAPMPAQAATLDVNTSDPIAALKRVAGVGHNTLVRKIAVPMALVAAAALVAVVVPGIAEKFGDALVRAVHADPVWVVGGIT